jgi:hypothetical protein
MLSANREEYLQTKESISNTQDCITEYMKVFYGLGAVVVSICLVLSRTDIIWRAAEGHIYPELGFVPIMLSFTILSFGSIMFHKFITHNRYSGYAQAISFEQEHTRTADGVDLSVPSNLYLWELCLNEVYNNRIMPSVTDASPPMEKSIKQYLLACQEASSRSRNSNFLGNTYLFILRSTLGAIMIIRAPFLKAPTTSWTYPYFIAFGIFVAAIGLALADVIMILVALHMERISTADWIQIGVQLGLCGYLFLSWLGMFNRLYRVCSDDGDRTISYFFNLFLLVRKRALARYGIQFCWKKMPSPPAFEPWWFYRRLFRIKRLAQAQPP